ncbi:MAG: flotillin family protein [Candidatus Hydrogenedens sp.]|nr:flotillin family protein [Candidatus Hydrogenedens sp.]
MFGITASIIAVVIAIVLASFLMLLATRYKRCPSNNIMVIYGKVGGGSSSRCIHGGAAFIVPLIQDHAFLSLEPIQIEVPLRDALSMENIRVNVPSVFTVAIGTDAVTMNNAAIRLLGLPVAAIKKQSEDIIFGQLRQVIASMRIEEINRDRDNFLSKILNSLEPELRKIGLVLINVNITDITDNSGYIEAIGKKAASEAVQQARADVAEQEKMGEIKVAENVREKEVQVAEAHKNQAVGIKAAEREQAIRIAEFEKEQKVGEERAAFGRDIAVKEAEREMRVSVANADAQAKIGEQKAAFQREMEVNDAERDKRIRVAEADARAIEGENTSKAAVAKSQAELKVQEATAYQLAETKTEQSKAAVLEARNLALAKAALADAERVEAQRRAELEAPAKAEKAKTIVEAEAEAEKRRIEAEGEAKAIFARLEAEARGEYEKLRQKGEGLREIVNACGNADAAFRMLMLEHIDQLAKTSAEAISKIKFDKVVVWENGGAGANGKSNTANFLSGMANVLPPMLHTMKDIAGIELPEYLVRINEDEAAQPEPKAAESKPAAAKPEAPKPAEQKPEPPAKG